MIGSERPEGAQAASSPAVEGIAAPPASKQQLSLEAFRALYREQMRTKKEAAKLPTTTMVHGGLQAGLLTNPAAAAAAVPAAGDFRGAHPQHPNYGAGNHPARNDANDNNGAPPQQQQQQRWLPAQLLEGLVPGVVNLALVCLVFTQGNTGRFVHWFLTFGAVQIAMFLLSRVKVNWRKNRNNNNNNNNNQQDDNRQGEDVRQQQQGVRSRGRLYLFLYIAFRCVTTFFVSMFPSFRVEALEKELRDDGLSYDHDERERAREALRHQEQQ
jgi:hypothetical protein